MSGFKGFDDLDEDFSKNPASGDIAAMEEFAHDENLMDHPMHEPQAKSQIEGAMFESKCPAPSCRNGYFIAYSGRVVGPCRRCKGAGVIKTKTNPASLAKAKASRQKRKVSKAAANDAKASAFLDANPAIADWFSIQRGRGNDFAQSLWDQMFKKGELSPGQLNAVNNSIERDADRAVAAVKRDAANTTSGLKDLIAAFGRAVESGKKKPILRLNGVKLSLAPATGVNAGHIYVKSSDDDYLGKITPEGAFRAVRDCNDEQRDLVLSLEGETIFEEAVAYGRETGQCSCCGRVLTNPLSIELGIGPICREGWGL